MLSSKYLITALSSLLQSLESLLKPLTSTLKMTLLENWLVHQGLVSGCLFLFSGYTWERTKRILSRNRIKQQINYTSLGTQQQQHDDKMCRNLLLGVAIGDSYGAGVEFESLDVVERLCDGTRYVNCRGSYLFSSDGRFYEAGMYTDDTEMTLGLCHCLSVNHQRLRDLDENDLLSYWLTEFWHVNLWKNWFLLKLSILPRKFFAYPPRNGHGSFKYYALELSSLSEMKLRNSEQKRKFPGNGPIMRCLPIAFVSDTSVAIHLCRLNANSTHPHVKARASTLIMVLAARIFLFESILVKEQVILSALDQYLQLCQDHPDFFDQETTEYLQIVDALPDYHTLDKMPIKELCGSDEPIEWASKHKGSPVTGLDSDAMRTVGCVLYLLKYHQSHIDTLLSSVRIGGDVDSLASITMGLVCGRFGVTFHPVKSTQDIQVMKTSITNTNALPEFFIYELEGVEYILEVAEEFSRYLD